MAILLLLILLVSADQHLWLFISDIRLLLRSSFLAILTGDDLFGLFPTKPDFFLTGSLLIRLRMRRRSCIFIFLGDLLIVFTINLSAGILLLLNSVQPFPFSLIITSLSLLRWLFLTFLRVLSQVQMLVFLFYPIGLFGLVSNFLNIAAILQEVLFLILFSFQLGPALQIVG